ncbi:MAG TPA: transcriptional repressor [Xanthomonadaceae bacterium]|nr:transcriptional repressor [Xanthomonadaceae bacterium]
MIEAVEKICRERGLRLTPLRADVLRLIAELPRAVKAYDVLERIRASKAITAPPTVYRSLDFLLDNGFIHKLDSLNAFVACQAPQTIHTGTFLICDDCHAAIELLDERVDHLLRKRARATGFTPHTGTQTLEIHGTCKACTGNDRTPTVEDQ